jgi:hypothetical protein
MPEFRTEVPHQLGQHQAVERLKNFVDEARDRFRDHLQKADGNWNGNVLDFSLHASGITVTGQLTVEDAIARVRGKLPFLALPMRGMIEKRIADQLRSELS